eukprot:comp21920_c0_seq1/m.31512 comp21920_c0_seq1/g.31512  ORF comp21920_c0_seq1/g.31512 comp21920_c0_seq1/m.31512 type:complete len:1016 (-) comp21920_c0_seq1:55-3102(-)
MASEYTMRRSNSTEVRGSHGDVTHSLRPPRPFSSNGLAEENRSPRMQPRMGGGGASAGGPSGSGRGGGGGGGGVGNIAANVSTQTLDDEIAHSWEWHTHYKPVFCGVCNKAIWAFARQCSKCMLDTHEQCARQAPQCMGEESVLGDYTEEENTQGVEKVELVIKLMSCSNLAKRYVMHQPDPFAILSVSGQNYRSHVAKRTFNPVWNSRHVVTVKMSSVLNVAVYDNKRNKTSGGGFLGAVSVPVSTLLEQDLVTGVTVAYRLKKRQLSDVVTGLLVFSCKYNNPSRDEPLAAQYLQQLYAMRARRLTQPMFNAEELDKNPAMRDVVSNMDSNYFGDREPDNRPNAQLRSYGLQSNVASMTIDTSKLAAVAGSREDGKKPSRLPPSPAAPTCVCKSETSINVKWGPEDGESTDKGKTAGIRYTLVRDQGSPEAPTQPPSEDGNDWVEEYFGTSTEHTAVALQPEHWYRFRLKASNAFGGSEYGPWSEPIKTVKPAEEQKRKKSEPKVVVEDTRPHCPFYMSGYCQYGANCPFSHGTGIQDEDTLAIAMLAAALNQDAVAGTALAVAASLKESATMPIDTSNLSQFKRDLHNKHVRLREKLHMPKGECHLTVVRASLFASSYAEVMNRSSKELKKKLFVHFKGEGGLDYGGLAREWFFLLSHELFSPARGLFEFSDDKSYLLQLKNITAAAVATGDTRTDKDQARPPEPRKSDGTAPDPIPEEGRAETTPTPGPEQENKETSACNPADLLYYSLVGKVLGLAVYHNHFLDVVFVKTFYKALLGQPIELSDLEEMDPSMHQSLLWMLENRIEGVLDQTFSVDTMVKGQLVVVDLVPNGGNIEVTDHNKEEFVNRMVQWRAMRGTDDQMEAIRQGFYEFIPQDLLAEFTEHELELLISGVTELDVADWRKNTIYKDYKEEDDVIKWFWTVVEEANRDMRLRMLQFVTGTQRIPPEGFQALIGTDGPRKFCIQKVPDTTKLPSSHTCFNRLDLPPYATFEEFKEKFYTAVQGFQGFSGD